MRGTRGDPGERASELLDEAEERLRTSEAVEHPHRGKERMDAEELLSFVLDRPPRARERVPAAEARRFRRLVERRAAGAPAAYLTRRVRFKGMWLAVGPGAFIPRESSEFMADQAVRRLARRPDPAHVDVATGIGPVALAVARAIPRARVVGVDVSRTPVLLARRNARTLGLANARFLQGDLFAPLPPALQGGVDVVTAHPPYVPRGEVKDLPGEIRRFEPVESLTDRSPRGMGLVERLAGEAPAWLRPDGWLLIEVSADRAREVATIMRRAGFREVRSTKDRWAITRVVVGRRPL